MMNKFGERSEKLIKPLHPALIRVLRRAMSLQILDFSVISTIRTMAEQTELYSRGRTKPGKIVTWTMESKHLVQPDGYVHAFDVAPSPVDWMDIEEFHLLAGVVLASANIEGVKLRWGGRFEKNKDYPHFELVT